MPDPLEALPIELVEYITDYLKPADIWRAHRTAKRWRETLTSRSLASRVARAYASHDASDSVVVALEDKILHMIRHCVGRPYALIDLPLPQTPAQMRLIMNNTIYRRVPILKGGTFAYFQDGYDTVLRLIDLPTSLTTSFVDTGDVVLTADLLAFSHEGPDDDESQRLFVRKFEDWESQPALYLEPGLQGRLSMAADKYLIAVAATHDLILYNTQDLSQRHSKRPAHDDELPPDTPYRGFTGMLLDADNQVLYEITHTRTGNHVRSTNALQVRRFSFGSELRCDMAYVLYKPMLRDAHARNPGFYRPSRIQPIGRPNEWALEVNYSQPHLYLHSYKLVLRLDGDGLSVFQTSLTEYAALWKDTCYTKTDLGAIRASSTAGPAVRAEFQATSSIFPMDYKSQLFVNDSFLVEFNDTQTDDTQTDDTQTDDTQTDDTQTDDTLTFGWLRVYTFDQQCTTAPVIKLVGSTGSPRKVSSGMELQRGITVGPPLSCQWEESEWCYAEVGA